MVLISCFGQVDDPMYYKAKAFLDAAAINDNVEIQLRPLIEPEWEECIFQSPWRVQHSGSMAPAICVDGEYLGSVEALMNYISSEFPDVSPPAETDKDSEDMAKNGLLTVLQSSGNSFAYMDIKVADEKGKRVFFELYQHVCPKTCENFMGLCSGSGKLKYKGSLFHRVVPGGWIQGGDIITGKGDGGKSIYGDTFEDESFAVRFNTPGVLAMASKGAHTNASQFFVTVAPLPWMDSKAVAFGRVVKGMDVIRAVEETSCVNERPDEPVKVDKCGVVNLKSTIDFKF